ncbi:MAG TPA: transposase [Streptosporangiaceae bacterium]|nr:transposase [Streptosporangiaceae bacterium]
MRTGAAAGQRGRSGHRHRRRRPAASGPVRQLCAAHVQRELPAVTDTAGDGQWCWAGQACDALAALQIMAAGAIERGRDALDDAAVAEQITRLRPAARIGISQTRARSSKLEKKHSALARRLTDRQAGYLRFLTGWRIPPGNNAAEREIRMIKFGRKCPAACAPWPGPSSPAQSAATWPPPRNTASTSSTPSSSSPMATPVLQSGFVIFR